MSSRLLLLLALLVAAPVRAENDGWAELSLEIANHDASEPLACQLLLAHWFEERIGPVPPGARAVVTLGVRPGSGEIALANLVGDRMRIERLACGGASTPRRAWAEPPLDRLRHASGAVTLACRTANGETACVFD